MDFFTEDVSHLANQLLIAMPGMLDDQFAGTVVYVCEHNDQGAMGLVVNRPTNIDLKDLKEIEIPVQHDIWVEKTAIEVEIEEDMISMEEEVQKMKDIIDEDIIGMSLQESLKWYAGKTNTPVPILELSLKKVGV